MIMLEDCGIRADGRISTAGLGLYDDEHHPELRMIVDFCHEQGTAVAMQLGHSGRKAFLKDNRAAGFRLVAPSPIAFDDGVPVPHALDLDEIAQIVESFALAAQRAVAIGFDCVEIHASHGYLLHEFLSPLTNHRTDHYGVAAHGGQRLVIEVMDAVRSRMPAGMPLFVRMPGSDATDGGSTIDDGIELAKALAAAGADVLDVTSGGVLGAPVGAHTFDQPAMAARIRRDAGCATVAVGGVESVSDGDALLADGVCDLVGVGRALLDDPYWVMHAEGGSLVPSHLSRAAGLAAR
jgi:2,4-dienoyl-CoA reductase-like NADH-dependent reductase (Old Yellow Enzyme family)